VLGTEDEGCGWRHPTIPPHPDADNLAGPKEVPMEAKRAVLATGAPAPAHAFSQAGGASFDDLVMLDGLAYVAD
jgi:hypothetical protein